MSGKSQKECAFAIGVTIGFAFGQTTSSLAQGVTTTAMQQQRAETRTDQDIHTPKSPSQLYLKF
jgi:hypothetical protein